jgi:hypothetical protein
VRQAVIELGLLVADECKPHARPRLLAILRDPASSLPALIFVVRQATEEARAFALLKEHLDRKDQPEIPPQVQKLLEQRVNELLKEREQAQAVGENETIAEENPA